ncbi:hypothetical protein SAMN06309944_1280 [Micrococcales bacterium KH10]|nr:hypothetical protein SAMN06309944_1280 [Micrococcales bacterium KH10]
MTVGTESEMKPTISHDEEQQVFVATLPDHGQVGSLRYEVDTITMTIVSTVVNPNFNGRGYAAMLAQAAFEHAREQHWQVVPQCSYIDTFLSRNPQYGDLVVD